MKFQYIFLSIFGVVAVLALVIFSTMPSSSGDKKVAGAKGNVVIWGTFSAIDTQEVVNNFNKIYKDSFSISYVFHDPKDFDRDIVEALASGKGPDILLLPDDLLLRHSDKIELIPYTSISQRDFQALFIQASEIYMRDTGVLALPFMIDPMVMYWNRDLFNNASITEPPVYWDEFLLMTPKLTKRDRKTTDIVQSAVPFGEYVNVENAKDILAMLLLQVGNPLVARVDGKLYPKLTDKRGEQTVPNENVVSALRFFMDFSNPLKNIYTWNRSLKNSRDEFIEGNLAVYFGHTSEYKSLRDKNPHLNFSAAPIPQPRETTTEITLARVHGLAVLKSSKNKQTAFIAVQRLLDKQPSDDFSAVFALPPVRRDLLSVRPTDAATSVFYDSAIRARTWLDPEPSETDDAFRQAVESVSSGRSTVPEAVVQLSRQFETLLTSYNK